MSNPLMGRRRALRLLGGAFVTGAACSLHVRSALALEAGSPQGGRFIVIFLRGALDGLFAFAPVDDPRLASLRPQLAEGALSGGLRLQGTGFAAHPSCAALAKLFEDRQLAFCPTAGTSDASRSHFQAQDLFELGTGAVSGGTGFMARLASVAQGPARGGKAISFTRELPLAFAGAAFPPAVAPLTGSGLAMPRGRLMDAIRSAHAGLRTGQAIEQAIATQAGIEAAANPDGSARRAVGANGFAAVAGAMGRMLAADPALSIAYLDIGGFDTHTAQERILTNALSNLGDGLVQLREELGPTEWRRTRVAVMTEFGRTARQNGTLGTDHGHGSLYLLAGGAIDGGRMIGRFDGLAPAALHDDRDLPVLADWRDLLADAASQTLGLSQGQLDTVFPGRPRRAA